MQQTQENCSLACVLLVLTAILAPTLEAAAAASDPLLSEAKGPCDPGLAGPDYAAGTDVNGNPVMSADVPTAKVPVPDGIVVPLGGRAAKHHAPSEPQAYAELNRKDVDAIVNPRPACPAREAR